MCPLPRSPTPLLALALLLVLSTAAPAPAADSAGRAPGPGAASAQAGAQAGAQVAVSPQPDTPDASPQTQISLLGVSVSALGPVTVTGSRSGEHSGRLLPYSNGDGASFVPDRRFRAGEQVHVRVEPKRGGLSAALDFSFTVAHPAPAPISPKRVVSGGFHVARQSFRSRPTFHPPKISVTADAPGASSGDIFVAPLTTVSAQGVKVAQRGPMILDPHGRLVWFHPLHGRIAAENFRAQVYERAPVLTWWQGRINPLGFGEGEDVIWDSSYRVIARVRGGNGYHPDLHEFLLTPRGGAWFTIYTPVKADLSSVGGPRNGSVLDGVVQEVDVKTGLVMFEWHSLGHIPLKESYAGGAKDGDYNYTHLNSIQDLGDRVLISARNTWAVYEVSIRTGQILWRLGGKHSDFSLGAGARFAWQHDASLNPDGTLTLFDNESAPSVRPPSRALALRLDAQAHTATVAHQWTHAPPLTAATQGSAQSLPNGDTLVGWGSEKYFSEYGPAGQLLFDARFTRPIQSYRAFRQPWSGQPGIKPAVKTRRQGGRVSVYVSWNGSTAVASWQVVAGPDPNSLTPIADAPRTGFEATIGVQTSQPYLAVRALDAASHVLSTSRAVKP